MQRFGITLALFAFSLGLSIAQNAPLRVFSNGMTGLDRDTALQRLDVNGAIRLANTNFLHAGSIRWNGADFEGYDGSAWISLTDTADADNDPTNEIETWATLAGIPVNIDTDSTDDFSGSWNDLTDVPANLDTDATDDFSGSWNDLTDVPADLADGDDVNDADNDPTNEIETWATLAGIPVNIDTDSTDDFSGSWNDLTDVPTNLDTDATDDFSGSWNDLTDVPADLADGDDVNDADNDPTNEIETWATLAGIPVNIDTDSTDDFSGSWNDLTDVPANLDTDATDDFSGSWNDLTDVPADLADGDDVNDADNDPTNEIETWATLAGIPVNIDTDSTDDFSGSWNDLTDVPANLDTDATDDFSGSWNDLTDVPADLADGDDVNDADNDPTNEIETWATLAGIPVNIDTDSTDDFSGSWNDLTDVPANLDTDATDDFSGSWNDLTDVPADLADGDDVNDADNDPTNEIETWATLAGIPVNIDTDSTDDFSGSWNDLTDVPANLDTDATDDFSGSWNDLTDVPADLADGDDVNDADNDPTNEIETWATLAGIPANIDTDSTDDFSGSWNDLADVPTDLADGDDVNDADNDPTNEIQVLSVSNDTLYLTGGGFAVLPAGSKWSENGADIYFDAGKVGVGTNSPAYDMQVDGDLDVTGELTAASDQRLKKNISTIQNASSLIAQLRAVSYEFRTDEFSDMRLAEGQKMGLIAQELEKILPALVSTADTEEALKSVNYMELIPLLIAAVQELQEENHTYRKEMSSIKSDLEEIKAMLGSQNDNEGQISEERD